ncbi:MAG: 50S ribosomal protein L29 [Fibrobacterota bacterium]
MEKARDLRVLGDDDLKNKERDLKAELFNLRFRQKVGQLENPLKIRTLRRDIARVKALLHERRRAAQNNTKAEVK